MKRLIEKAGTGLTLALLASCVTASPTPEMCAKHGVLVEGEPTGVIVEEHYVTPQKAQALCQSPFEVRRGCALVVFPGWRDQPSEWVIVYTDEYSRIHEVCAARYNRPRHEHTEVAP